MEDDKKTITLGALPKQLLSNLEDERNIHYEPHASPLRSRANRRSTYHDTRDENDADLASNLPPSFAQSEFETIVRKQRNNQPHTLKIRNAPSRFPHLDNLWEFAGWGTMSYIELTAEDMRSAEVRTLERHSQLDQYRASSIAGNDMYGSVFYAFPAVVAVAGILSPVVLLVACTILLLYRPIFLELGSAVRFNGAIYAYLLQCSGKTMALIGTAAMCLDGVATASVSAATVSAYISGEVHGALSGMKGPVVAMAFLVFVAAMGLMNIRESSGVTLSFTVIHLATMAILMVASIVTWARNGSGVLVANWQAYHSSSPDIGRSLFYGVCIAFLGVTGFETTPTYIESIRPDAYPATLIITIITATVLNAPLMLFVYAVLPHDMITSGGNVLSLLAEAVGGRWLRIIVVIDCVCVVGGGGVLAGLVSMCSLLERLALDRIIPPLFLKTLPTGSSHYSVAFFLFLAIVLYASSGFALHTISGVFSVSFLVVLLLYAVSNMLLKFNRDRLPRRHKTSLGLTVFAFLITLFVFVGNIIQAPGAIGLFAAYFAAVLLCLFGLSTQLKLARLIMWLYAQQSTLQRWRFFKGLDASIVKWIKRLKSQPIVVWVKGDDIYNLVEAILYIRKNEITARIIFLHAYMNITDIPPELEANVKLLDEAFPAITLDLIFLKGEFNPTLVEAASAKIDVPKSQMLMDTMGHEHGRSLADYGGVRVARF
ncbi:hypothetical protein FRB96_005692 [Tulasnella sp. 330]|nr:hypothetical protein FRB96_005692 [Tulasnella sp. 330]KAG8878270.1 hypothetical protein FRB97_002669 [Tulasnella sp. 331]KAG8883383.1 hypothetical protein FRB98_003155 [Tulasnella sp. 332]